MLRRLFAGVLIAATCDGKYVLHSTAIAGGEGGGTEILVSCK